VFGVLFLVMFSAGVGSWVIFPFQCLGFGFVLAAASRFVQVERRWFCPVPSVEGGGLSAESWRATDRKVTSGWASRRGWAFSKVRPMSFLSRQQRVSKIASLS
jgi:hypothetical protein